MNPNSPQCSNFISAASNYSRGGQKKNRMAFSTAEDELLRKLVEEHGEANWTLIAKSMPHRNPRQCRDRWRSYLRPTLVKSQWTDEEDSLLLSKYHEFGPKWSVIGRFIPGRSEITMKNRWKLLVQEKSGYQQSSNQINNINGFNGLNCSQMIYGNGNGTYLGGEMVSGYQPQPPPQPQHLMGYMNNYQPGLMQMSMNMMGSMSNCQMNSNAQKQNQMQDLENCEDDNGQKTSHVESSADTSAAEEKQTNPPQDLEAFFNSLTKLPSLRNAQRFSM